MQRADNGEMPPVECGYGGHSEALGNCDDRSVDRPQRQIMISGNELGYPYPIGRDDRFRDQVSLCEVTQELHLGHPANPCFEQICDFRHDELWDNERTGMRL
jgi:hypothetical protein